MIAVITAFITSLNLTKQIAKSRLFLSYFLLYDFYFIESFGGSNLIICNFDKTRCTATIKT